MITESMFLDAIKAFEKDDTANGVIYNPIKRLDDGRYLCLVFGWGEGYDKDDTLIQRDGYTLCAKLAINIDDLQCDYDIDWYMPYDDKGNVWDTDMSVDPHSWDWYDDQAKQIIEAYNKGEISVN